MVKVDRKKDESSRNSSEEPQMNNNVTKKTPIKIGFVNTLTGAASTSTIKIRDVVILAVEEKNKEGGINGHRIELIIKNDEFDPEVALKVDQELIDQGVIAIIGHSFSSLCLKVAPLIKKNNILMISPTAQSPKLRGIDVNFISNNISIDKVARAYAITTVKKFNLKKICIVYDMINPGLAMPAVDYFKNEFEKHGGEISSTIQFNSKKNFSAPSIVKKIINSNAEGVYLISDAIHTALICQHLKINNSKLKIFAHGWALQDSTFINEGGNAVEGVIGTEYIDKSQTNEKFLSFEQKYIERYGDRITGIALSAYETITILFNALLKTNDPKKLETTILNQKSFKGIDGKIIFDEYGDPIRTLNITEIKNGKAVTIGKIEPVELLNN